MWYPWFHLLFILIRSEVQTFNLLFEVANFDVSKTYGSNRINGVSSCNDAQTSFIIFSVERSAMGGNGKRKQPLTAWLTQKYC